MNRSQLVGIVFILIGIALYIFTAYSLIQMLSGIFCAIGLGFILKWLPLKNKK